MRERDELEAPEEGEATGLPPFVRDPFGILRRRWRWVALALLLVGSAAGAYLALRPVTYEASARLMLSRQRIPEDFVRSITIEGMNEQVSAIVGEILSSSSLENLIEEERYRERAATGASGKDLLNDVRRSVTVEPVSEMRGQSRGSSTYIFEIRFTSQSPELAADMANGLVSRFVSAHARRQSRQAKLTTEFLEREAERAGEELESVRTRIAEFMKEHRGQLPSELDTKLARLTRLQQQRDSLATQLSEAEGRLVALRSQSGGDRRTATLEQLEAKLSEELIVHTEDHPNVKALERQIAKLEADLRENPPSAGSASRTPGQAAVQREIRSLKSQIASVEKEIERLDAAVARIPEREEELAALRQQEALLQEKYTTASRKVREAQLAESLQRAQQGLSVSVLESAWPPTEPRSSQLKLAALAAMAALGAGAGVALFLELWDPVLLTSGQLELHSGRANLGVIPRIR